MPDTIIQQLADFTAGTRYDQLPAPVVDACKRILLDSIGCAVAAVDEPKGRIGIDYARLTGGHGDATIIGTGERVSMSGAAFANGELINALDMDAVVPPGHVTPYVLPGALAVAETSHASGQALIEAIALSHEMSYRIGKAMDYLRDTRDGKVAPPPVYGYSSTVFGATAAIVRLKALAPAVLPNALGIAGSIAPVNSQVAWFQHAPSSTIKYLLAGALTQAAMTAAHMAELGHRGDTQILDDREYGFPRFIGTQRWEPQHITDALGTDWRFPSEQAFKPYPHCRILHALLDGLTEIVETNDIAPHEITGIKAWVEGFVEQPVWLNRNIEHVHDAQFSIAHGLALGAHRPPPGKAWQDPALVFGPSVMALMDKVTHEVHPNYVELLSGHAASRPAKIEVSARGRTFVDERRYPKGSPSPDPASLMTDDELIAKFRRNVEDVLPAGRIDDVIDAVFTLERADDVASIMRMLGPDSGRDGVRARSAG
ncbi:MmgE/PrpD family protein [Burkholderia lata]|uniref:2-methylcitrate dehydratase n=1 Tax=Burkholderia lata (strain ATCC 17760 / DSM 23089 / LMG 22485 / NCIMB 9086 / R18194 / 383) TaxID=482957 RepID=A0A6P2HQY9_BURL3|nr:MmgE/PrpD family protein [Burkholderia lata]VWB10046.1 2-methylcitrate dehydratase [Burkholderia lata]VWB18364.1 2-methylcitrate dehydratase [Burkholderia lata]